MLDMAMVAQCSPSMHPAIVQAIVKTESSFNPFAISVNRGGNRLARQPSNFGEAVQTAKRLLAQGANIDMGLGQINSANMNWLNLSVEQAFNPCSNLTALQHVYLTCYDKAGITGLGTRMQRAFSCYNTGGMTKGFNNGYVNKATNNFNQLVAKMAQSIAPSTPTSQIQFQPKIQYQTYALDGSKIAIDNIQINSASKSPDIAQNANMSVSVRSDEGNLNPPTISENIQADDTPIKVYNSWDIFKEF